MLLSGIVRNRSTHQHFVVLAHNAHLLVHAQPPVEVVQQVGDGGQPNRRIGRHTLPQARVEVGGVHSRAHLAQQRTGAVEMVQASFVAGYHTAKETT